MGRLNSAVLRQDRPTLIEVTACALGLVVLGVLVFGTHIEQAGQYSDDWAQAAEFRFQADGDFGRMADRLQEQLGSRPLFVVAAASIQTLWTDDLIAQHALAVTLAGVASLLFFVLLRTVGMRTGFAGAAAALSFVFPWGDAGRLWAATAPTHLCVIFYFAGCLVAVRGLRSEGIPAALWHAAAIAFYLLSVLVYEAAALAILLTGLLYLALAGWPRARVRWAADAAVMIPALVVLSILHHHGPGIQSYFSGLKALPGQGTRAVLQALVPVPVGTLVRALIVIVVIGLVLWAVRRLSQSERRELIPPVASIAAVLVALAIAWIPFLGAGLPPMAPGIDNRGNLLAGFVMALLVVAVAWLCREVALRAVRRPWAGTGAAVLIVTAIGTGWTLVARSHADDYVRAADSQEELLGGLSAALSSPPSGATIFTLSHPAQSARGVPVFSETWDLNGAVRLLWDDRTLHGFPIVGEARLSCGGRSIVPRAPRLQATAVLESGLGQKQAAPYGQAFLYDGRTGKVLRVDNAGECRELVGSITPGPILPED